MPSRNIDRRILTLVDAQHSDSAKIVTATAGLMHSTVVTVMNRVFLTKKAKSL